MKAPRWAYLASHVAWAILAIPIFAVLLAAALLLILIALLATWIVWLYPEGLRVR